VPEHESIEKAAWIYDSGGACVLHLASADVPYSSTEILPTEAPRGGGAIHHVAFSCADFDGMQDRLTALGLNIRVNRIEKTGVRQIFVRDPTDILFELNFSES
jgi:catechol 2,3-dioxygenase-like lactoylglutathione lyase family enzyme